MPKQKRWTIKRDLDQAVNLTEKAETYIMRVGEQFKGVHDEYYKAFQSIFISYEHIHRAIMEMKELI